MNFFNRYKKIEKLAAAITPRPIASRFFSKKIIFSLGLILLITGFFGNIEKTKAENLVVKSGQWTYKPDTKTWVYGKDKDVAPNAAGDLTAWGVSDDNAFAGIKTDLGTNNGFTFIGPGGQPNTNFGTSAMERVVGRSSQSGVFIGAPWNDTFKKIENGDPSIAQSLKTAGDLYTKVGSDGTMIVMKAGKNGIPDVLSASSPDDTVVGVVTTDGNTVKYSVFNDNIKNSTDQTTIKNAVNTYVQSQNGYLTSNSTNYDSVSGAAYQNQYGTTKTQYELTQENSNLTNQAVQLQKELEALQDEEETGVDNSAAIAAKQAEIEALTDKITANNNTVASTTSKAKNQSYTNSTTNDGLCWRGLTSSVGVLDLGNCLSQIAYYILSVFSWAVGIAGWLLNNIIEYTVVNIRDNLNQINAINTGWTVIRDLVNIFFIFILLYIAISTILGLDEHGAKHALAKVVIFGILINFSMFFTKVIIDTSNIFTLQFYSKITTANNQHMGEAIMAAFNTPGIYNTSGTNNSGNVSSNNAQNFAASSQHTLVVFIMGTIMLCTAAGVLVGASWIFLKRFVVFIFLLISSPVAFAGMILHSTEHHTKAWWSALMAEIIAAPVLMIMLWLAFSLIGGGGTGSKAGIISSLVSTAGNDTSSGAVQTLANAIGFNIFFNFAIVTALFSFALVAAQKLGASGATTAGKISNWTRGAMFGGLGTAGAFGFKYSVSKWAHGRLNKGDSATEIANRAAGLTKDGKIRSGIWGKHIWGTIDKYSARAQMAVSESVSKPYEGHINTEVAYRKRAAEENHDSAEMRTGHLKDAIASQNGNDSAKTQDIRVTDIQHHGWSDEQHANNKYLLEQEEKGLKEKIAATTDQAEQNKLGNELSMVQKTLSRYYTGGHANTGRLTALQAINIQRMGQDKLLAEQRQGMHNDLFGTHGHPADLDAAKKRFLQLSEKQKAEYVSSLDQDKQKQLFTSTGAVESGFRNMLRDEFKVFSMVEQAVRGSNPTEELKGFFSKLAIEGAVGRKQLFERIGNDSYFSSLNGGQQNDLYNKFEKSLSEAGIDTTGARDYEDLIKLYKDSGRFRSDKTFKRKDNNLNRILEETKEVQEMDDWLATLPPPPKSKED